MQTLCCKVFFMLYKFKSKVDADLIMLEPHGRRILEVIGKTPGTQGILLHAEFGAAQAALERAIAQDRLERQNAGAEAEMADSVSLQQRATPFIALMQRCAKQEADITW